MLKIWLNEKENQCVNHNETTKKISEKIEKLETKVNILDKKIDIIKFGSYAMIINILITAGNIIFQLLKKG